jgi:rhomboid protease GlpG
VFNLLMLWFLGGQVEHRQGRGRFFLLFIACSIVPNVAQYLESGPLFGGMSGVVYGLVGYCWLWNRLHPGVLVFPSALMGLSVAWLIVGYTPLTEALLIGKMANSAHLFGLLMGLFVAIIPLRSSPDSSVA